jgi:hypothetical protein
MRGFPRQIATAGASAAFVMNAVEIAAPDSLHGPVATTRAQTFSKKVAGLNRNGDTIGTRGNVVELAATSGEPPIYLARRAAFVFNG